MFLFQLKHKEANQMDRKWAEYELHVCYYFDRNYLSIRFNYITNYTNHQINILA